MLIISNLFNFIILASQPPFGDTLIRWGTGIMDLRLEKPNAMNADFNMVCLF
ncbi:MAG: hypothetical protein ABF649_02335 [Bacillus sp. (in: firmicutes)]